MPKKRKAVIIDIDGTIAQLDQRLNHLQSTPKNWNLFYADMKNDKLHVWCFNLVQAMMDRGFEIIFCTGRPEEYRQMTKDWLKKNCKWQPYTYELFMRKDKDYRPDTITKKELYDKNIKDKYDILFVVEDRQGVVDMWRNLGLVTLQCHKGDY